MTSRTSVADAGRPKPRDLDSWSRCRFVLRNRSGECGQLLPDGVWGYCPAHAERVGAALLGELEAAAVILAVSLPPFGKTIGELDSGEWAAVRQHLVTRHGDAMLENPSVPGVLAMVRVRAPR